MEIKNQTGIVAGYKVIVAEDNRVLLDVIRFNFVRAGFDVRTATESNQVLRLLDEESTDLLVTDWRLNSRRWIN